MRESLEGGFNRVESVEEIDQVKVERVCEDLEGSQEFRSFLAQKVAGKLVFKDAMQPDDGSNDYAVWKRLGVFMVHDCNFPREIESILQDNGLDIYADEVLELHIPPQKLKLEEIKTSFQRIKEYLDVGKRNNRPMPKYLFGVSYLAKYASMWGFEVIDLPDSMKKSSAAADLLGKYKEDPRNKVGRKFNVDDIKLCYMPIEKLMADVEVKYERENCDGMDIEMN